MRLIDMDFTMSAKRNFNSNDILSVLKTGNFSTGEIARKIRCDRVTALKYLRELKAQKHVVETRISTNLNLWQLTSSENQILMGDCEETLKSIADESVDLIVTDPPYGYSFMNLAWDAVLPSIESLKECFRVLKAGGFGFFMCCSKQNLMAQMILQLKAAGFETGFSSISWVYSTGLPKSANISKLIDKRAQSTGETLPVTPEGKTFAGAFAGNQLKPAIENILVCMKPLSKKSYLDQALDNGKGCTWLKDCKIPWASDSDIWKARDNVVMNTEGRTCYGSYNTYDKAPDNVGRFPANLLCCDDALNDGDSGSFSRYFDLDAWFKSKLPEQAQKTYPCLIVPKPSKNEKNMHGVNNHPTVKPLKLMSYLITMGSREGDLVLDPFAGSGTILEAANMLKRRFIGCESDKQYKDIIEARAHARGYSR